MKGPNKKQLDILSYIKKCIVEKGFPPSIREICEEVGLLSPSTVHNHVRALVDLGFLEYEGGKKRAYTIVDSTSAPRAEPVPIYGKVAAGQPILATQEEQDFIPVSAAVVRGREVFALTVSGESMKNAGILDGDFVIVERANTAENGEIVVALIDEEATVKRLYKENGHIRLQPENDDFEPIIVKSATIVGKVISLIRNY